MKRLNTTLIIATALVLSAGALSACDETLQTADPATSEGTLSDLDILLEGAPDNDKLPAEAKSDQVFAKKWIALKDFQSPVKSQGGRGVCSIFSTVGLMEHLYIKEGTLLNPDFSEQFLQWSAKVELGRFTKTGGSNASANLDAVQRFGIVMEDVSPYQSSKWTTSNDEACTGDEMPVRCYTNGDPTQTALDAKRWHLPNKRFINSKPENIKAYMMTHQTAVIVGLQFFYQSWNHGGSKNTINKDYYSEGYVMYPNDADKEDSNARRAGHSILLIGWDDELEVPVVDSEGNEVTDADGDVVMEKGFWLFKNSWGTSGFGIRNVAGSGYGWLSMKYVEEFGTINGASIPSLNLVETCGDGMDNNYNGDADCDDAACADTDACKTPVTEFNDDTRATIPDNSPAGLVRTFDVSAEGVVRSLRVAADIDHSFPGDLLISLTAPSGERVLLFNGEENMQGPIPATYAAAAMIGEDVKGTWTLTVADVASKDTGTLNSWGLVFDLSDVALIEICGDGVDNDGNGAIDCADAACGATSACQSGSDAGPWQGLSEDSVSIPDNDTVGADSVITIDGNGHVGGVQVFIEISHTYVGDLTVSLIHPDGTEHLLQREEGGSADSIKAPFTVDAFNGKAVGGDWILRVSDAYAQDTGTIDSWILDITDL